MAQRDVRIYRSRKPLKTALVVFFSLLLALIVLAVAVFLGFQKYIVYTSDGVKLDVPWLREPTEQTEGTQTDETPTEDFTEAAS